jgi:hypothetical protein
MEDLIDASPLKDDIIPSQRPVWLNDMVMVRAPNTWWLCDMSEKYLEDSFQAGDSVTIINGSLVVKPIGKLAGLCIEDVVGSDGKVLFKKGNWYCPVGECRDAINSNFGQGIPATETGKTRLNLEQSEWCLMRPAKPATDEELEKYLASIRTKISTLPTTFQVRKYRNEPMEGQVNGQVNLEALMPDALPIPYFQIPSANDDLQRYLRSHIMNEFPINQEINMPRVRDSVFSNMSELTSTPHRIENIEDKIINLPIQIPENLNKKNFNEIIPQNDNINPQESIIKDLNFSRR